MLSLASPRWRELSHAYGSADDVPDMLEALREGDDGRWPAIWSSLCHQTTVYTATYAAVPHLVATVVTRPLAERWGFFLFVGTVAAYASAGAPCPADLEADYRAALVACRRPLLELLVSRSIEEPELLLAQLEALAALHGHEKVGRDFTRVVDGHVLCADCEKRERDG